MYSRSFTDSEIIAALQGDSPRESEAAMYFLYEKYRVSAIRWIEKRGGNKQDGEDVFQEAILELMGSVRAGKYQNRGKLKTYFFGILKNMWNNQKRKKRTVNLPQELMSQLGSEGHPEKLLLQRDREKYLNDLMQSLGNRCRKSLWLYASNYSMEAIANELEIEKQSAKNLVHRCRQKLRALIEKGE